MVKPVRKPGFGLPAETLLAKSVRLQNCWVKPFQLRSNEVDCRVSRRNKTTAKQCADVTCSPRTRSKPSIQSRIGAAQSGQRDEAHRLAPPGVTIIAPQLSIAILGLSSASLTAA